MSAADVIVCRAGATTLAEMAAAGRAAMLCRCRPPPTITSARTPRRCRAAGAAEVLEQRELTGGRAGRAHPRAAGDDEPRRADVAAARKRCARPDAARVIVDRVARASRTTGEGHARRRVMLGRTRRIHFVGIGGIGMSGIAELLANLGYDGQRIGREGVGRDRSGWRRWACASSAATRAEHVGDADVVVVSSAVRPTTRRSSRRVRAASR